MNSSTDLFLGLDVGTTATKALLVDGHGREIASASYSYGLITPQDGWVEQDADELWRAVVETCRSVGEQVANESRIAALGLSSQAGTAIPIGSDGRPTHNAFSWMDHRASQQAQRIREQFGADFVHRTTGWPLGGGLPLLLITWFRENHPKEFAATERFLFVNDFIVERLTGRLCTNPSDAGITQLMNLDTGDWDKRLLAFSGAERNQLSPIQPSGYPIGTLTVEASEATGLDPDLLVVNGAHDQYCAAVGAGVTRPGQVLLSCGTAWVILAVPDSKEKALNSGMAVSRHAVEGRWGAIRSMGGVGTSMEWLLDNVWGRSNDLGRASLYDTVNRTVGESPPGADGLYFCPLAGGHGVAFSRTGGGFLGLSLAHTRADMARAVMEGISYELRWVIQEMQDAGLEVAGLTMVGGAAESEVWPQIVADVTGLPVTLPSSKQAAGRGAAILAAVGVRHFGDPEEGFSVFGGEATPLLPSSDLQPVYEEAFRVYQRHYEVLRKQ
jgi:sugar (pentulose or hexulose) kinase